MAQKNPKPDNYFEGILQLRDIDDEVIDYAISECEKQSPQMIAKIKACRNGIDIFVQSNRFLKKLGKIISEKYNGELITTAKLHTRDKQKSKNLYRITVLFRQCRITKGDILVIKGDEYKVMGIAKKVNLKSTKDGRKRSYSFGELNTIRFTKIED